MIVSSTDGVGTKTAIAAAMGRLDTIGIDLVAMCADDVACTGAEPLAFLDYIAIGRLDPGRIAALVSGIADGCRQAGAALTGGETAEHPGLMEPDEFDLAGFCVGVGERSRLLDGTAARPGDAIVGLAASGLHANGYSLVRALVAEHGLAMDEPYVGVVRRVLGDAVSAGVEPELAGLTLGDVLLTPTRIYARDLLGIRADLEATGHEVRGMAHVTGGGLPGNVPRALPGASRGTPRSLHVADAVDHGRAGRAGRDRGSGAPRDVQRRAGHGGRRAGEGRRGDRGPCPRPGDPGVGRGRGGARGVDRWQVPGGGERTVSGRIAIGVSGTGSNLRALAAAAQRGVLGGDVVLVFADRACPGLDWAAEQGLDTVLVPGGDDTVLAETLAAVEPDVVVLAGYLRLVGPAVLGAFGGRILNVHPSLLPSFPGLHGARDALAAGVAVTGVTVHLVDATLDGGPIVAQEAVPVLPGDTEDTLLARIHPVEHRLLPGAVAALLAGALRVDDGARRAAARHGGGRRPDAGPEARPPVRLRQVRARGPGSRAGGQGLGAGEHRRHRTRPAR